MGKKSAAKRRRKLNFDAVMIARDLRAGGLTLKEIAAVFGVSEKTIRNALRRYL